MIMNPQININGTGRDAMVNDRRAVLDALKEASIAMAKLLPHGRDYVGRDYQFSLDRALHAKRQAVLYTLTDEIMAEALDIQGKA